MLVIKGTSKSGSCATVGHYRALVLCFSYALVCCGGLAVAASSKIYECDHNLDGLYVIRYCALRNVIVLHDAEDVDFRSDYPRPYTFEFYNSSIAEIPRIMFTTFPEMQVIGFQGTGIESINKFTFEHAKQLRQLNISHNQLTALANYIFKGCDRLTTLDLSHNRLEDIKELAFSEISKLEYLDLSNNQLATLHTRLFASLEKLSFISLASNRLQVLSDQLFASCAIATLALDCNQLDHLSSGFLANMKQLDILNITSNKVRTFRIPLQLKRLFAANNQLESIYCDDPSRSDIYALDVSSNLLSSIDNITALHTLGVLDVSFNALGPLALTTFLKLQHLYKLNLEATKLPALEHGIFAQQSMLRELDISFNDLQTLDLSVLTPMTSLQKLYLDGNNLTAIDYTDLPAMFPKLSYVGLYANQWNCSYLVEMIRYCVLRSISVEPQKAYGFVSHQTNIQGIYCISTPTGRIPWVAPVHHRSIARAGNDLQRPSIVLNGTEYEYKMIVEMLDMIRTINRTNLVRFEQLQHRPRDPPAKVPCYDMHANAYQVFILLILTVILVINVGFLLWVHYNLSGRKGSLEKMIIFRRERQGSIETTLEGEF